MRGTRHMMATIAGLALLAGCAGGTQASLAADACDLLEELADAGPELLMDEEAMQEYEADFAELEERADESDLEDEEMEQAMRDECPEVFETFGGVVED